MQQVRVSARIKRKPTRYEVSVVTRDEVGAYKPYLWEQSVFEKGPMFRYFPPIIFAHKKIFIEIAQPFQMHYVFVLYVLKH